MSHTPGPWLFKGGEAHYGPTTRLIVFREGYRDIALVIRQSGPLEEDAANANLIAAAPDLLSALRDAELFLRSGDRGPTWSHLLDRISTAIRKAEGNG